MSEGWEATYYLVNLEVNLRFWALERSKDLNEESQDVHIVLRENLWLSEFLAWAKCGQYTPTCWQVSGCSDVDLRVVGQL